MIRTYLKVIFRNFFSDGLYTVIIVLGLAVGIAVSLIIAQYVQFELSFDKQIKDGDRIYYTYMNWNDANGSGDNLCHPAIGPFIKRSVPEIEEAVRITPVALNRGDEWVLRREKQGTIQSYSRTNHMYLADPEILDFFSIPMLAGDPHTALLDPQWRLAFEQLAEKLSIQNRVWRRLCCRATYTHRNDCPNYRWIPDIQSCTYRSCQVVAK